MFEHDWRNMTNGAGSSHHLCLSGLSPSAKIDCHVRDCSVHFFWFEEPEAIVYQCNDEHRNKTLPQHIPRTTRPVSPFNKISSIIRVWLWLVNWFRDGNHKVQTSSARALPSTSRYRHVCFSMFVLVLWHSDWFAKNICMFVLVLWHSDWFDHLRRDEDEK